jgi:hypothetical protein
MVLIVYRLTEEEEEEEEGGRKQHVRNKMSLSRTKN